MALLRDDSEGERANAAAAREHGFCVGAGAGQLAHDLREALLAQERLRGSHYEQEFRSPRPFYETSLWLAAGLLIWFVILICL